VCLLVAETVLIKLKICRISGVVQNNRKSALIWRDELVKI